MHSSKKTIWGVMQSKGYNRRDFLQFCTMAAVAAGIEQSAMGKVVEAFEKVERPPIVWLHFQECTCCSESFIRASHPDEDKQRAEKRQECECAENGPG